MLSEKFNKELDKFYEWMIESDYMIRDVNDVEYEWNIKLLEEFEEPGRNKLEAYIKGLLGMYSISINGMDVNDAKLLSKKFKDRKETKKETKKETNKEMSDIESSIRLDMSLDNSDCYYISTLENWSSELVKVFGMPRSVKGKEHKWEWIVEVNGYVHVIYDWNYNNVSFDEVTWCVDGYNGCDIDYKKNMKVLNEYISSMLEVEMKVNMDDDNNSDKDVIEMKVNMDDKDVIERKVNMDEIFNDESDDEFNLDDIIE